MMKLVRRAIGSRSDASSKPYGKTGDWVLTTDQFGYITKEMDFSLEHYRAEERAMREGRAAFGRPRCPSSSSPILHFTSSRLHFIAESNPFKQ